MSGINWNDLFMANESSWQKESPLWPTYAMSMRNLLKDVHRHLNSDQSPEAKELAMRVNHALETKPHTLLEEISNASTNHHAFF